jgi:hypothetical protein
MSCQATLKQLDGVVYVLSLVISHESDDWRETRGRVTLALYSGLSDAAFTRSLYVRPQHPKAHVDDAFEAVLRVRTFSVVALSVSNKHLC